MRGAVGSSSFTIKRFNSEEALEVHMSERKNEQAEKEDRKFLETKKHISTSMLFLK
jgi:hypothetical protein